MCLPQLAETQVKNNDLQRRNMQRKFELEVGEFDVLSVICVHFYCLPMQDYKLRYETAEQASTQSHFVIRAFPFTVSVHLSSALIRIAGT